MDKMEKLQHIMYLIQELYPELDRMILSDIENPDQVIFASTAYVEKMSEELGISFSEVDEINQPDIIGEDNVVPIPIKKGLQ